MLGIRRRWSNRLFESELKSATDRLERARLDAEAAKLAEAFAHGYIYGQRAIIRRAGLDIPLPKPVSPEFRDIALKHGFLAVADDR